MTGMRSWMWASCALGRVVTIVQVRSGSTSGRPRHVAHSPAKANGSPSGARDPPRLRRAVRALLPLVEAVGDDEAAPARERVAERRLLGHRLRAGVDELQAELGRVVGPVRDEAPAQHLAARRALAVGRDREHLVARRDVEAPAHLDALADREAVAQDRRVGPASASSARTRLRQRAAMRARRRAPSAGAFGRRGPSRRARRRRAGGRAAAPAVPVPPNGSEMSLTIPKPTASSTMTSETISRKPRSFVCHGAFWRRRDAGP